MSDELVILVDEENNPVGTMPKSEVHRRTTPLHRAFSCFLWRSDGQLLLQQRSLDKGTWPGVWSNSVCGHPLPGEAPEDAVRRRLRKELGIGDAALELVLPEYRYRASYLEVEENEICPVWIGVTDERPRPSSEEVNDIRWIDWDRFVSGVQADSEPFFQALSPWCREETLILHRWKGVRTFLEDHGINR